MEEGTLLMASASNCSDCSLCLSQFDDGDHLPKKFDCRHSVCKRCLTDLNEAQADGDPCPLCHMPPPPSTKDILIEDDIDSIIHPNYRQQYRTLMKLLENDKDNQEEFKCHKHPEKNASQYCMVCSEPLCSACVGLVIKGETHSGHELEDIDETHARLDRAAQFVRKCVSVMEDVRGDLRRLQKEAADAKEEVARITENAIRYAREEQKRLEREIDEMFETLREEMDEDDDDTKGEDGGTEGSDVEEDLLGLVTEVAEKVKQRDISILPSIKELEDLERMFDEGETFAREMKQMSFKVTPKEGTLFQCLASVELTNDDVANSK